MCKEREKKSKYCRTKGQDCACTWKILFPNGYLNWSVVWAGWCLVLARIHLQEGSGWVHWNTGIWHCWLDMRNLAWHGKGGKRSKWNCSGGVCERGSIPREPCGEKWGALRWRRSTQVDRSGIKALHYEEGRAENLSQSDLPWLLPRGPCAEQLLRPQELKLFSLSSIYTPANGTLHGSPIEYTCLNPSCVPECDITGDGAFLAAQCTFSALDFFLINSTEQVSLTRGKPT